MKPRAYIPPTTENQKARQQDALKRLRGYSFRQGMHANERQLLNRIKALRLVLRALHEGGQFGVEYEERVAMHEGLLDAAVQRGLAREDGKLL